MRYAGKGAMEAFFHDGNVLLSKGYLTGSSRILELMDMLEPEFDMYCHHLREQNSQLNLG